MQCLYIVDPLYEGLLPKLSASEQEALEFSISAEGQHYPIIVNEEGVILDGHHRFKACQHLGLEPRVEVKKFVDKLLERKFVIEVNLRRRHLNDFQRAELAYPLLEIEGELAKHRMGQKGIKDGEVSSFELGSQCQARDIVAQQAGLSPTTFQRAVTIIKGGSEELKEKVRKGDTSINYAYKQVNRSQDKNEPTPLPEGEFDVIYADPPWKYDLALRGSPDMHYPVMEIEDIIELKVPSAKNAVLFLWATNPKLEDALTVMENWGFVYKSNMVWVKPHFGTGYYFRGQHELLLVGTKGNISVPAEADRPSSVLQAPLGKHSEKPEAVYSLIESMYPNHKYLELFAVKTQHGWEAWGK
jgi:N6-adenosine-specific RNA methylase IME4